MTSEILTAEIENMRNSDTDEEIDTITPLVQVSSLSNFPSFFIRLINHLNV